MGRAPCCDKQGLKKGPWSPEEDKILADYIQSNGHGSWRSLPKLAGLLRCGKSCRLRWTNYLRPDIKRGPFTPEEQKSIIQLHGIVGNKWSTIAVQLPGRTDNEIKNFWNTHLKKRLLRMGINPETYAPASSPSSAGGGDGGGLTALASPAAPSSSATRHMAQWESARLEAEARLSRESLLFSTSGAADAAVATTSSGQPGSSSAAKPDDADFFLRIWNSEVGEAFRCKDAVPKGASPASSSTKRGSSSALTVVRAEDESNRRGTGSSESSDGQRDQDVECKSSVSGSGGTAAAVGVGVAADSSSSNEMEDASEEERYQMFLNFAGDDMALGSLFHGHIGNFSLFGSDISEASLELDTAFK